MNKIIKNWNKATQELAQEFVDIYYNNDADCEEDRLIITQNDWVGGEIGGILFVADHFWNIDRMKQTIELKASYKMVFDYYYLEIEKEDGQTLPNFKNYVKYFNGFNSK